MNAPDRTVRHLHLRAHDEADVRSGARRLEDALRCASLPDHGGRLLLVRRLDLGRLPADISSQSLALLVERRVRECGYTWVHGATPEAAQSNTVWFRDTADALITLAAHAVRRTPQVAAWFWSAALPDYSSGLAPAQTLEMIVAHLAAQSTGRVALAELVAALARMLGAEALPTLFTPAAQRELHLTARQLGMRAVIENGSAQDAARIWCSPQGDVARLSPAVQMLAPWLPILLGAARWTQTTPVQAVASARGDGGTGTGTGTGGEHNASDVRASLPAAAGTPAFQERAPESAAPALSSVQSPDHPAARREETPPAPREDLVAPADAIVGAPPTMHLDERHASQAAGLLFLLPLLTRLGFDAWSAALTPLQAQSVAVGVLRQAVHRLRVTSDDPVHALLATWPATTVACDRTDTPALWRDPRIALQMPGAADSAALAALWLIACRRSLRRAARIGLASLVLRPGALAWSLTHLDAHFDLTGTDLRVRRNGLDIDPGWLPWLGRVVGFHYQPGLEP